MSASTARSLALGIPLVCCQETSANGAEQLCIARVVGNDPQEDNKKPQEGGNNGTGVVLYEPVDRKHDRCKQKGRVREYIPRVSGGSDPLQELPFLGIEVEMIHMLKPHPATHNC